MHEVHYASGLLMVILTLHLTQHLEVTRLIFRRIVLDVPKFSLRLNRREIELWKLKLFLLDAATDIRAVFEGLAEKRLNNTWNLEIWEDQRTCFQCSLQRRNKDDVWFELLMFFPSLNALWSMMDVLLVFP